MTARGARSSAEIVERPSASSNRSLPAENHDGPNPFLPVFHYRSHREASPPTRAIGFPPQLLVVVGATGLGKVGTLLLCSDRESSPERKERSVVVALHRRPRKSISSVVSFAGMTDGRPSFPSFPRDETVALAAAAGMRTDIANANVFRVLLHHPPIADVFARLIQAVMAWVTSTWNS